MHAHAQEALWARHPTPCSQGSFIHCSGAVHNVVQQEATHTSTLQGVACACEDGVLTCCVCKQCAHCNTRWGVSAQRGPASLRGAHTRQTHPAHIPHHAACTCTCTNLMILLYQARMVRDERDTVADHQQVRIDPHSPDPDGSPFLPEGPPWEEATLDKRWWTATPSR
jgi:hypothetical protein